MAEEQQELLLRVRADTESAKAQLSALQDQMKMLGTGAQAAGMVRMQRGARESQEHFAGLGKELTSIAGRLGFIGGFFGGIGAEFSKMGLAAVAAATDVQGYSNQIVALNNNARAAGTSSAQFRANMEVMKRSGVPEPEAAQRLQKATDAQADLLRRDSVIRRSLMEGHGKAQQERIKSYTDLMAEANPQQFLGLVKRLADEAREVTTQREGAARGAQAERDVYEKFGFTLQDVRGDFRTLSEAELQLDQNRTAGAEKMQEDLAKNKEAIDRITTAIAASATEMLNLNNTFGQSETALQKVAGVAERFETTLRNSKDITVAITELLGKAIPTAESVQQKLDERQRELDETRPASVDWKTGEIDVGGAVGHVGRTIRDAALGTLGLTSPSMAGSYAGGAPFGAYHEYRRRFGDQGPRLEDARPPAPEPDQPVPPKPEQPAPPQAALPAIPPLTVPPRPAPQPEAPAPPVPPPAAAAPPAPPPAAPAIMPFVGPTLEQARAPAPPAPTPPVATPPALEEKSWAQRLYEWTTQAAQAAPPPPAFVGPTLEQARPTPSPEDTRSMADKLGLGALGGPTTESATRPALLSGSANIEDRRGEPPESAALLDENTRALKEVTDALKAFARLPVDTQMSGLAPGLGADAGVIEPPRPRPTDEPPKPAIVAEPPKPAAVDEPPKPTPTDEPPKPGAEMAPPKPATFSERFQPAIDQAPKPAASDTLSEQLQRMTQAMRPIPPEQVAPDLETGKQKDARISQFDMWSAALAPEISSRLDQAASQNINISGTGRIAVDVSAPPSTSVTAKGEGFFSKTDVTRQTQMLFAETGPTAGTGIGAGAGVLSNGTA